MAEFSINKSSVLGGSGQLDYIVAKLLLYQAEVGAIRSSLSFQIAGSSNIRSRLKMVEQNIDSERKGSVSMASGLRRTVQKYNSTEMRIMGRAAAGGNIIDNIKYLYPFRPLMSVVIPSSLKGIFDYLKHTINVELGDYKDLSHLPWSALPFLKGLDIPALRDMIKCGSNGFGDIVSTYNNVKNWVEDIPDELIDATTLSGTVAANGAYWDASVAGKYGSAGISVFAANAYAEGSTGLLSKTEEGELYINPHIDAKAGVCFTALHIDGEAYIGDNMFGARASGSADIGRVAADGSISAGILSSDGKFDPRLKAKADFEAVAVDAKAEAGITVLGTEAKVSGSVNIGIGAHADVGYQDGILSFDIGASLGIGASIGFEVDVGGTIDAVKGWAKSALSKFGW